MSLNFKFQTEHEARALHLTIEASKLSKYDSTTLDATYLLCRLYNRLRQPQVTEAIVETTEAWVESFGDLAGKDARSCMGYIFLQGSMAEALLLQNKVSS